MIVYKHKRHFLLSALNENKTKAEAQCLRLVLFEIICSISNLKNTIDAIFGNCFDKEPCLNDRQFRLLKLLNGKICSTGCVAYAAGISAVTDIDNLVKALLKLFHEGEIGTYSERENNDIDRDLTGTVVLRSM